MKETNLPRGALAKIERIEQAIIDTETKIARDRIDLSRMQLRPEQNAVQIITLEAVIKTATAKMHDNKHSLKRARIGLAKLPELDLCDVSAVIPEGATLEGIRAEIAALRTKGREIAQAPCTIAEMRAKIDSQLGLAGEKPVIEKDGRVRWSPKAHPLTAALHFIGREKVLDALLGVFSEQMMAKGGDPVADRDKKLAAIHEQTADLELIEEALVEAAHDDASRRISLSPFAFFGVTRRQAAKRKAA